MSGWLDSILASKREEVSALRVRALPSTAPPREPLDVVAALRNKNALALIAEIKFKSPSAGALSQKLIAAARAEVYARGGAAMISVLCDRPFFGGSYEDLRAARRALDAAELAVPILAKEFVIDEAQVALASACGADAVLLIARLVSPALLETLAGACRKHRVEPFVEVVDETELDVALAIGARVIGVNARDLDTLVIDSERAARVLARIPRDRVAAHLSGFRTSGDVKAAAAGRADAALVGEAFMREDDPIDILKIFVGAAQR